MMALKDCTRRKYVQQMKKNWLETQGLWSGKNFCKTELESLSQQQHVYFPVLIMMCLPAYSSNSDLLHKDAM